MRNVRILIFCFLLLSPIFIVGQEKCETCLPVVNRQKAIDELIRENDPHGFIFTGGVSRPRSNKLTPPNSNPVINDVFLSKTKFSADCDSQLQSENFCDSENNLIEINVSANDSDGDFLLYQYVVSAGKLIGTGSQIKWDVSGLKPGIYTISVLADDGCGLCGQPAIKEIEIVECAECKNQSNEPQFGICPRSVEIVPSATKIKSGEVVSFSLKIDGENLEKLRYGWFVQLPAEIIGSSDSATFKVKAPENFSGKFIVGLIVGVGEDSDCENSQSWQIEVIKP